MTGKKYKSKWLWLFAAIFWMGLIFYFSSQKAEASSQISGSLTWRLAESIHQIFRLDWNHETLLQYAIEWEHPIRKAAHMTEYAVFAWILLGNFSLYPRTAGRKYFLAEAAAALYAATDEFHQLFVEGRSGQLSDVCVDAAGACIGLLLVWAAVRIRNRKR